MDQETKVTPISSSRTRSTSKEWMQLEELRQGIEQVRAELSLAEKIYQEMLHDYENRVGPRPDLRRLGG